MSLPQRVAAWSASLLLFSPGPNLGAAPANTPVFSRDIAPVVFKRCTVCHRPDEAAPFSLLNFAQVKRRGKQIAQVVADRYMPPWKIDESDFAFRKDRRLSANEILLIEEWVKAGMPEGNPADAPPVPHFSSGWALGEPDLIVKMKRAFPVPADGRDIYRNFVVPLNLTDDKWVRAIDFRPGARSVLHHSLFFYDTTGTARALDGEDGQPGYGNRMNFGRRGGRRFDPSFAGDNPEGAEFGILGGWAVGGNALELPDGLSMRLPKEADLILSTHFHPDGKPESEASTVAVYFAREAPAHPFTGLQLPPLFGALQGIDIPAGDKDYEIEDSFVIPVDVRAFGLGAHAHYLGRSLKMTATLPGGPTRTIAWIKDWDFSWQEQYLFADDVELPAGTRLTVRITYDNSVDNPRNPSNPPVRVRWGEQSTDEMGGMTLLVIPAVDIQMTRLRIAYRTHIRECFTARMRRRWSADSAAGQRDNWSTFDKNGDGRITRDELPAKEQSLFDRFDANQNGVLDEAELKELQRVIRAGGVSQP